MHLNNSHFAHARTHAPPDEDNTNMVSTLRRKLGMLLMRRSQGGPVESDSEDLENSGHRNFGVYREANPAHRPSSSAHGSEGCGRFAMERHHSSGDPCALKGRPSLLSDSDEWSHASTTERSHQSTPVVVAEPWGSLDAIRVEMSNFCDVQVLWCLTMHS